jgi:hypothetical protein
LLHKHRQHLHKGAQRQHPQPDALGEICVASRKRSTGTTTLDCWIYLSSATDSH